MIVADLAPPATIPATASAAAAVSPLFRTVENTFSRMGWQSRRVPGREVLEADFEIHHSHARVHAQVFAEINAVSVIAAAGSG